MGLFVTALKEETHFNQIMAPKFKMSTHERGVARGEAEGARASPEFGRSVNPIQTRGARLYPSHNCQPSRIQKAIYISE